MVLITKLDTAQFKLTWQGSETILTLNFQPFLVSPKISSMKNLCLLHYQGKPKGLRSFGVYCKKNDNYFNVDQDQLVVQVIPSLISIEDTEDHLPNAVLFFENCYYKQIAGSPPYLVHS